VLGSDDGSVIGLRLGTKDTVNDGDVLGPVDSDGVKEGVVRGGDDDTFDGKILGAPDDIELGVKEGNMLGVDSGPVLGLPLGTPDDIDDGDTLGTDDGVLNGKTLGAPTGIKLGVTDGFTEGNALGNDDGSALGLLLSIEGGVDNDILGTDDLDGIDDATVLGNDDEHVPHVALHVWKKPSIPQFVSFAVPHVSYSPLKRKSTFESEQGSQVSHVTGQCVLTLLYLHLISFLLRTQVHVFLVVLPSGSVVLNLNLLSAQ